MVEYVGISKFVSVAEGGVKQDDLESRKCLYLERVWGREE